MKVNCCGDNNFNQTHVSSNQRPSTCAFVVSPASQVEVIQSNGQAQVKPALISEYIPKSKKSQQNPFLPIRHNFSVALIPRVFLKERGQIGFTVPTRKSSSTDRHVTGAWQVSDFTRQFSSSPEEPLYGQRRTVYGYHLDNLHHEIGPICRLKCAKAARTLLLSVWEASSRKVQCWPRSISLRLISAS